MPLIYNGTGEHIPGIPAQDLSDDEVTRLAGDFNLSEQQFIEQLTARGLYSQPPKPKRSSKKDEDKPEDKD